MEKQYKKANVISNLDYTRQCIRAMVNNETLPNFMEDTHTIKPINNTKEIEKKSIVSPYDNLLNYKKDDKKPIVKKEEPVKYIFGLAKVLELANEQKMFIRRFGDKIMIYGGELKSGDMRPPYPIITINDKSMVEIYNYSSVNDYFSFENKSWM